MYNMSQQIARCIAAAGPTLFDAYLKQVSILNDCCRHPEFSLTDTQNFAPELLEIGYYTADNAHDWLDIAGFMKFVALKAQTSTVASHSNPQESCSVLEKAQHKSHSPTSILDLTIQMGPPDHIVCVDQRCQSTSLVLPDNSPHIERLKEGLSSDMKYLEKDIKRKRKVESRCALIHP